MFSQSIFAQLVRMSVLLGLTLVAVHHYQPLLDLLAEQAVHSGCHQQTGEGVSMSHDMPSHHSHHEHHSHH